MSAAVNALLSQGQRFTRALRPATLLYGGKEIPCTPGNLDFFERLRADGGGFTSFQGQHITILRADIPAGIVFKRGQTCQVRDEASEDVFNLTIGENNSTQATIMILNLQSQQA